MTNTRDDKKRIWKKAVIAEVHMSVFDYKN
jgi:hypothetical protein